MTLSKFLQNISPYHQVNKTMFRFYSSTRYFSPFLNLTLYNNLSSTYLKPFHSPKPNLSLLHLNKNKNKNKTEDEKDIRTKAEKVLENHYHASKSLRQGSWSLHPKHHGMRSSHSLLLRRSCLHSLSEKPEHFLRLLFLSLFLDKTFWFHLRRWLQRADQSCFC